MPDPIKVMQNEMACVNRQITGCDKDCIKCDLVLEDSEIIAAYEAAIEALKSKSEAEEYRTPQKIENKSSLRCPKCNYELAEAKQSIIYMAPFCPNCGQALEWNWEEES